MAGTGLNRHPEKPPAKCHGAKLFIQGAPRRHPSHGWRNGARFVGFWPKRTWL